VIYANRDAIIGPIHWVGSFNLLKKKGFYFYFLFLTKLYCCCRCTKIL